MSILDFLFDDPAKHTLPAPDQAPPGRPSRCRCRTATPSSARRSPARSPDGARGRLFGLGCFWGAEKLLADPRRVLDRRRLRRRLHAEPDLRGGLQRADRPRRGRARRVRPGAGLLAELLAVFWENHDPTQGMRQGNDSAPSTARRSTPRRRAAAGRRGVTRRLPAALAAAGYGDDHHRDRPPPARSTTPRTTTSSTWPRTRTATARITARASAARSACRSSPPRRRPALVASPRAREPGRQRVSRSPGSPG